MKSATAFLASTATAMTMTTGAIAEDNTTNPEELSFFNQLAEDCQPVIDAVVSEQDDINPKQIAECGASLSESREYYYKETSPVVRLLSAFDVKATCQAAFEQFSSSAQPKSLPYVMDLSEYVAQRTYGCMYNLINEEGEAQLLRGTSRSDLSMMNRTLEVTYCLGAAAAQTHPDVSTSVFQGQFMKSDREQCREINPQLTLR